MKPNHGKISDLGIFESTKLLEANHFAHLACHIGDELYLVPVSYVFENGFFYSHSKMGKKIDLMRRNPSVCIQVEKVENFFRWKSVIAWGKFEELGESDAAIAMRMLIKALSGAGDLQHKSSLEVDFAAQLERSIIFRIKLGDCTGRSEGFSIDEEVKT